MTETMDAATYRNSGKEAIHQRKIINTARALRWHVFHPGYSLNLDKGFPDLTMIHADFTQTVWIEVKGPKGKVSDEQVKWLAWINERRDSRIGLVVFPPDIDAVEEYLKGNPVDIYEHEGVLRVRPLEDMTR